MAQEKTECLVALRDIPNRYPERGLKAAKDATFYATPRDAALFRAAKLAVPYTGRAMVAQDEQRPINGSPVKRKRAYKRRDMQAEG